MEDLPAMSNYNWSQAILDNLMKSVEAYATKPKDVAGCVMLLLYWLCERTNIIEQETQRSTVPRILKWNLPKLKEKLEGIESLDNLSNVQDGKDHGISEHDDSPEHDNESQDESTEKDSEDHGSEENDEQRTPIYVPYCGSLVSEDGFEELDFNQTEQNILQSEEQSSMYLDSAMTGKSTLHLLSETAAIERPWSLVYKRKLKMVGTESQKLIKSTEPEQPSCLFLDSISRLQGEEVQMTTFLSSSLPVCFITIVFYNAMRNCLFGLILH
ncbi:hypothetical protein RHGRI_005076 [Rhododendron griersonianum]|uniref:Uncharacterized protein n=1 Tax=Rhododendron griersonianum TaxID=479676 RepID=A0AAV6LBX9_9ERIC|nr:hypothetical protein RHGRI_005076 [Rhododendron griersonianum]